MNKETEALLELAHNEFYDILTEIQERISMMKRYFNEDNCGNAIFESGKLMQFVNSKIEDYESDEDEGE